MMNAKKRPKNTLTEVLTLLLCLALLTGCGAQAASNAAETPALSTGGAAGTAGSAAPLWQASFLSLEDDSLYGMPGAMCADGETLYFTSNGVLEDATPEGVEPEWPEQYLVYGPVIVKADLNGNRQIVPYKPESRLETSEPNRGILFEQICAGGDDTLWVIENHFCGGEQTQERRFLSHIRTDGTALGTIPLDSLSAFEADEISGGSYTLTAAGMVCGEKGELFLGVHEWFSGNGGYSQRNHVDVFDAQSLELKHTFPFTEELIGLVRTGDGAVICASYSGAFPVFRVLDAEKKSAEEVAGYDDFISSLSGSSEAGKLCFSVSDAYYRLDTESGETEKLFDWTACGVSHREGESVCVLPDGRIATICEGASRAELVILSPTEGAAEEKTVLTMAVLNLHPYTMDLVSRFNRSSSTCRIEVTDYAQYNDFSSSDPKDWNAGLTRLQTELIAGNVPDILDVSVLPVSRLGEKGLLEDLIPYIEADSELRLDDLNGHVLSAFEQNGKLYQTVSNFYVLTTAGLCEAVGEQMGWTFEDFRSAWERQLARNEQSTVFDVYTTKDDALTFLMYLELDSYVDWSTGQCTFDSDGFRSLLSFLKDFPDSINWASLSGTGAEFDQDSRLLSGEQLLKQCSFTCFDDAQYNTLGLRGAPVCFVGYPTEHGVGSMFAQMGNTFAISSRCADKDAAWQFVREFFLPAYQEQFKGFCFPSNRAVYEEMKREAMAEQYRRNPDGSYQLDGDGRRVPADRGSVESGGMVFPLKAATEEDVRLIEEIIASTTHVVSTDESLKEIIATGAAAYFAGEQDVQTAAAQIQGKADLYVNEQR